MSISILSTILLRYRYRYRRYFHVEVSKVVSTILLRPFFSILRYRYFLTDLIKNVQLSLIPSPIRCCARDGRKLVASKWHRDGDPIADSDWGSFRGRDIYTTKGPPLNPVILHRNTIVILHCR